MPTADQTNVRLARPSRGARPAQIYPIDYRAILEGDASANLQILPGDRLIVGRDPIVETSVALNRLAEPFITLLNAIQVFGQTVQRLDEAGRALDAEEREQVLERWFELWHSIADRVGADDLDDDEVRDLLRRLLVTPPLPVPTHDDPTT